MFNFNSIRNMSEPIKFVNTSMHGVSDKFIGQAFQTLGFPAYTPVLKQQFPDPDFPSVFFPNPEEKGMRIVYELFLTLILLAGALVSICSSLIFTFLKPKIESGNGYCK